MVVPHPDCKTSVRGRSQLFASHHVLNVLTICVLICLLIVLPASSVSPSSSLLLALCAGHPLQAQPRLGSGLFHILTVSALGLRFFTCKLGVLSNLTHRVTVGLNEHVCRALHACHGPATLSSSLLLERAHFLGVCWT